MASDGLLNRAITGTCHMCQRARNVDKHLKAVGEVHHGYATGHIWECKKVEQCDESAKGRLNDKSLNPVKRNRIEISQKCGRITNYRIIV